MLIYFLASKSSLTFSMPCCRVRASGTHGSAPLAINRSDSDIPSLGSPAAKITQSLRVGGCLIVWCASTSTGALVELCSPGRIDGTAQAKRAYHSACGRGG